MVTTTHILLTAATATIGLAADGHAQAHIIAAILILSPSCATVSTPNTTFNNGIEHIARLPGDPEK